MISSWCSTCFVFVWSLYRTHMRISCIGATVPCTNHIGFMHCAQSQCRECSFMCKGLYVFWGCWQSSPKVSLIFRALIPCINFNMGVRIPCSSCFDHMGIGVVCGRQVCWILLHFWPKRWHIREFLGLLCLWESLIRMPSKVSAEKTAAIKFDIKFFGDSSICYLKKFESNLNHEFKFNSGLQYLSNG